MKYWLKHPGSPGFIGPLTLDEIRDRLQNGSLKWTCEAIEARGQSLAVLEQCRIWQPIETICSKESLDFSITGEICPPGEYERSPSEKALAELRFNTAYPGVRKGIGIIQNLLVVGSGIGMLIFLITSVESEGFGVGFFALLVKYAIIYAIFYLIKNALITLLDISDHLVARKTRR